MNDVMGMGLHEQIIIRTNHQEFLVTRVPGGWLYDSKLLKTSTFVPYSKNRSL